MSHRERGLLGALAQQKKHDPRDMTQQAREAFLARFETEVDPRGELLPEDRHRRASAARREYMLRLAARSAEARGATTVPPGQSRGSMSSHRALHDDHHEQRTPAPDDDGERPIVKTRVIKGRRYVWKRRRFENPS